MGPLMMAMGVGATVADPALAGSTIPLTLQGAQQTFGPGGVGGPSLTPGPPPNQSAANTAAAPSGPPPTPEIPTAAPYSLALNTPGAGAGAGTGTGGGVGGDMSQFIAQNILQTNPFSTYA